VNEGGKANIQTKKEGRYTGNKLCTLYGARARVSMKNCPFFAANKKTCVHPVVPAASLSIK
jgi:hypothetical protein